METTIQNGSNGVLRLLNRILIRWGIFFLLFVLSIELPRVLPGVDDIRGPLPGFWLLWIITATAPEGFTDSDGAIYLQDTGEYIALAFWVVIGLIYAVVTRRMPLRYVVLGAYPTMMITAIVVTAILNLFGYSYFVSL